MSNVTKPRFQKVLPWPVRQPSRAQPPFSFGRSGGGPPNGADTVSPFTAYWSTSVVKAMPLLPMHRPRVMLTCTRLDVVKRREPRPVRTLEGEVNISVKDGRRVLVAPVKGGDVLADVGRELVQQPRVCRWRLVVAQPSGELRGADAVLARLVHVERARDPVGPRERLACTQEQE